MPRIALHPSDAMAWCQAMNVLRDLRRDAGLTQHEFTDLIESPIVKPASELIGQLVGVYQIGEVYALSCVTIGISSGVFRKPKTFTSYAGHRGVGISSTRT